MGKNQSASNLTNIIKQDANGNISFVSGSTTLMSVSSSGAITTTGNVAGTASYASNAELLDGLDSTVFTLTSSFTAQTASFTAFTASQNILNGKYATTGSNTFTGIQTVNSNLIVTGSITAQTLVVQTITSSVDFVTGSTRFGSLLTNTHVFSGSVSMNPGGLFVSSSNNVGIGTTTPTRNLEIVAGISNNSILKLNATNANGYGAQVEYSSKTTEGVTTTWVVGTGVTGGTNSFEFFNGSSTVMFISSSGNVGIGTSTPVAALHIYSSNQNVASTLATSYTNAKFRLEPFNTSGVGISMGMISPNVNYLQSAYNDGLTPAPFAIQPYSGSVGIGTTTIYSGAKLHIVGGLLAVEPTNGNTNSEILLGRGLSSLGTSAGSGITAKVNFAFEGSNDNFYQELGFVTTTANQTRVNSAADFYISTKAAGSSSPSEKFRITSGGNVGINDSSPTSNNNNTSSPVLSLKSTTAGAYPSFVTKYINGAEGGMTLAGDLYIDIGGNSTSTNNNIIFRTTNTNSNYSTTERLRISSAGNLNFNTAGSGAAYININQATSQDGGFIFLRNNVNRWQQAIDGSNNMVFYSYQIGNNAYKINLDGSATLYGALTQNASDRRLKNNITNIPNALDKIKTLNGVTFTWENEIYKTDKTNDIGVIAQEVQSVLPDAVTLAPFDIDSEGNSKSGENYLTVYYEKLVPLLIEGIKELNTKLDASNAEIEELKNK